MANPGDIVLVNFAGVEGTKKRPAVIVSTALFHSVGSDLILAVLTSNVAGAKRPTDYVLQDWRAAGLHLPTAFRPYMRTEMMSSIIYTIGALTPRDWQEVQARLRLALAVI